MMLFTIYCHLVYCFFLQAILEIDGIFTAYFIEAEHKSMKFYSANIGTFKVFLKQYNTFTHSVSIYWSLVLISLA